MPFSSSIRLLSKSFVGGKTVGNLNQYVVSSDKLAKMIRQDQERRAKRQRKSSTKPKAVKFVESENMRHFNRLVKQNLSLLKSQSALQSIVVSTGLVFTQVSVTPSWGEVYIFWKASSNQCSSESIQEQLDSLAPEVRHQLNQLNELGKIPKVIFAQDYHHVRKENFLNLMSSFEPLEVDEDSNEFNGNVELKTDVLNFDRDKAMTEVKVTPDLFSFPFLTLFLVLKILKTLEKSKGAHRLNHNEKPSAAPS